MIYETMKSRRSIRSFKTSPPSREELLKLIEAAITAPSASNKQPWRFVIVTNRDVITRLAAAVRGEVDHIANHVEAASEQSFRNYGDYFTRFEAAPVVIVTLFRSLTLLSNLVDDELSGDHRARIHRMERDSGLIGVAMAMQNLLLMAHDSGLGASGMTGPLVADPHIRGILDVPSSWEIAALVPVGFPAEEPMPPERKSAEKVSIWVE